MRKFIQRHLDPATRAGEAMFGLIMALGITGAVRLGVETATSRELFVAVLGCNLAWGTVDGVMFAMLALLERGRKARLVKLVQGVTDDEVAMNLIRTELGDQFETLIAPEQSAQLMNWVLAGARRAKYQRPRFQREDLFGGIAAGLIVLIFTVPIVIPFLLFSNLMVAVRLSNTVALALLFWVGYWWARTVGADPLRTTVAVTSIGVILVLITIALGG